MVRVRTRSYCLKLARDRERQRRKSRQEAFEFTFGSLDEFTMRFAAPGKIAALSDGGRGAAEIGRAAACRPLFFGVRFPPPL